MAPGCIGTALWHLNNKRLAAGVRTILSREMYLFTGEGPYTGLQHGGAPPGCQTLVQVAESVTIESSMTDVLLVTPAERYDELLAVHDLLRVPLSCMRLRATCYSSLTAARIEAAVRRARSWGVCCMSVQRTARGHCTPMFLRCTSLTRACCMCAQNPDYDR